MKTISRPDSLKSTLQGPEIGVKSRSLETPHHSWKWSAEAEKEKKSWTKNFLLAHGGVVFQPRAPDDGTLVAEHEDNFSTLQLCA